MKATAFAVVLLGLAATAAAKIIKLTPETAVDPQGNYTPLNPGSVQLNADGSWFMEITQPAQFFRLRIEDIPAGPGAPIPLNEVPAYINRRAETLLDRFSRPVAGQSGAPSEEIWENAAIAPFACPIFEPGAAPGSPPKLLEFKVVDAGPPPALRGVLVDPPEDQPRDLGYILVSLAEDNFPIVSFSNEGMTPIEQLLARAGTTNIVPVYYDNTLLVAEDAQGNLLANVGSVPFKIPPSALNELSSPHEYAGDDDAETETGPEDRPLGATHYASYAEFRADFQSNPVYQLLRAKRAANAKEQWDIEKGIYPEVIMIEVNETKFILEGQRITGFSFFSEDSAGLRVEQPAPTSGLRLTGVMAGDGRLRVEVPDGIINYAVRVGDPRAPGRAAAPQGGFTPGLQPLQKVAAGGWDEQPKYKQLKHSDWCPLTGCGPVAWSMLFAWFEREHDVKGAFGNILNHDAPGNLSGNNKALVLPVYHSLHELCDVICGPGSDQGATEPGDMAEGGLGSTQLAKVVGAIKRSYKMKWTICDACPEDGALECAGAIKKGYPAVVGLGWFWHYALAYAYARQDYKLTENSPPLYIFRYLKCNMGWGDTNKWYNLCDTFFSSDFQIKSGPNAQ